ncbi:MAG: B12-binding domain-containing radical SAM protein [Acidobacteriota bacterium]|nr:B12-binding domain-containing radical SAM protein [Acidobacteriota bacterium]
MRLLLTHGYFIEEDPKERQIMKPYAPLGILYLSSYLSSRGFDVEVHDSTFSSKDRLFRELDAGPAGVLGIYGNLMTRASVLAIAQRAKDAGWLVMLGGPEPSNYAGEFLGAGADLIVAGEGERAVERLAAVGFARNHWGSIPGLVFRNPSGETVSTGPAETIQDLDSLPWPDRGKVDIDRYLATWRGHHGTGSVSVITARGCPYRCNWCSHSVFGHTHRRRKPRAVADEIEWLLGRYRPDMLWMADDVFTIHPGWIGQFAAEMKRRNLRIPFECITRADRMDERMAATMADLGCMRIWIGSESGSQRILDAMERGVTVAEVHRAVEACRKYGIQTGMFLMWGYDGEEIVDIEATVEHVKRCRPDIFFTTVSYPIKGTPYFSKVASRLVKIGGWAETTDRDLKVRGRHSRAFYRYADDLLRTETAERRDSDAIREARAGLRRTFEEVEA